MTTQQKFREWYELHGNGLSYHAQLLVWNHQQARIDEFENKLAIAMNALKKYHAEMELQGFEGGKCLLEALKLIEVRE